MKYITYVCTVKLITIMITMKEMSEKPGKWYSDTITTNCLTRKSCAGGTNTCAGAACLSLRSTTSCGRRPSDRWSGNCLTNFL